MESDVITLQYLFVAKPPEEGQTAIRGSRLLAPIACTGLKPHFLEKMASNGVLLPPTFFRADVPGKVVRLSPPGRTAVCSEAHAPQRSRSRRRPPPWSRGRRRRQHADHGCGRQLVPVRPRHRGHASAHRKAPKLSENGQPVIGFSAKNFGREKSVVLLFDRSQSMLGQAMRDATAAARSFVRSKPASDRIAVVAVGKQAFQLTGFSSGTAEADSALRGLEVDKVRGTALYDAVISRPSSSAPTCIEARVLVLLTDGQEVSSKASLEDAIAAANDAHVTVYPIANRERCRTSWPTRLGPSLTVLVPLLIIETIISIAWRSPSPTCAAR